MYLGEKLIYNQIDLESICNDMYNQHKKFMRMNSDNDYSRLSKEDTIKLLCRINEFDFTAIDKNRHSKE